MNTITRRHVIPIAVKEEHTDSIYMIAAFIHATAMGLVIFVASSTPLSSDDAIAAVYWSLMPIIGALGASLFAFLLNNVREAPKAVAGRAIGAMAMGLGAPRIAIYTHPWLQTLLVDPILLILAGFVFGLFGYAVAKHTVCRMFKESPKMMDNLAGKVGKNILDKIAKGEQT